MASYWDSDVKTALKEFSTMPTMTNAKFLRNCIDDYFADTKEVKWKEMMEQNIKWWTAKNSKKNGSAGLKENHWVFNGEGGYDRETILKESPAFGSLLVKINKLVITEDGQDGQYEEPATIASSCKDVDFTIEWFKKRITSQSNVKYVEQITKDTISYSEQRPYLCFLADQVVYDRIMEVDGLFSASDMLVTYHDRTGLHCNKAAKKAMKANDGEITLASNVLFFEDRPNTTTTKTQKNQSDVSSTSTDISSIAGVTTRSKSHKRKYFDDNDKNIGTGTGTSASNSSNSDKNETKTVVVRLNPSKFPGYTCYGPRGMTVSDRCYKGMMRFEFDSYGNEENDQPKFYFFTIMDLEFRACGKTFLQRILNAVSDDLKKRINLIKK